MNPRTTKLPFVSLSDIGEDHTPNFMIDGWKLTPEQKQHWLDKTIKQRTDNLGKVVEVSEEYGTIPIWSDESTSAYTIRATVWDDVNNRPKIIVVGEYYNDLGDRFTCWGVDASPEVLKKFDAWSAARSAAIALQKAMDSAVERLHRLEEVKTSCTAMVSKGRKHPIGIVGKVVWIGTNQYGAVAMLALSNRKDQSGRYKDIIYVPHDNLTRLLSPDEEEEKRELNDRIASLESEKNCLPV
jgi:hypothetical protein